MTEPTSTPPPQPDAPSAAALPPSPRPPVPDASPGVRLSSGEFLWLTFAVWLGGIFILTLMPIILEPRLGQLAGIAGSYFVFFMAWQPIQSITQRTFGTRTAFVRMLIFVGGAASLSFYLRGLLFGFAA